MAGNKPLVVVFLATGAQGSSVATALVASGRYRVRGLTRSTESDKAKKLAQAGVEMFQADYTKKEDVERALEGAYGAYIVTDFWTIFDKEFEVGKMAVELAKAAGVKHLLWSTLPNTLELSGGKIDVPHCVLKSKVDAVVKAAGFEYYTFTLSAFYYQNLLNPYFHFVGVGEGGEVQFKLPMKPESYLTAYDTSDTGPPVLAVFDNPKEWHGKYVPLVGFHAPVAEYAAVFEKVKKRKAGFKEVPAASQEFKVMFDWFSEYTCFGDLDREVGKKLYPGMKTWEQFLESSSWESPQ